MVIFPKMISDLSLLQTPKKIKHKRKKNKMGILKYYKVDSDGKIKRLRRECPSAECGAGIFVGYFLQDC